jgi:fatty-acyl-CoA synthase
VSDERFGEEVCAWIKLREGASVDAQELRDYCRGKIAHYKVPRYIQFVTEFPMTVTGKAQKFRMREAAEATLSIGTST